MRSLLIDDVILKERCALDINVQGQYVRTAIETAQEIELQTIIGTNLLDALCDRYDHNNLTGAYATLYNDYVIPFMVNQSVSNVLLPISFKVCNEGVVSTGSDNSVQQGLQDVQRLETFYKNRADFYADRMTDWLKANSNNIPEWNTRRSCADMPSRSGGYTTGIYLEGEAGCGCDK